MHKGCTLFLQLIITQMLNTASAVIISRYIGTLWCGLIVCVCRYALRQFQLVVWFLGMFTSHIDYIVTDQTEFPW